MCVLGGRGGVKRRRRSEEEEEEECEIFNTKRNNAGRADAER